MLCFFSGAHKRLITSPPVAIFPHPLASDLNLGRSDIYIDKYSLTILFIHFHVFDLFDMVGIGIT